MAKDRGRSALEGHPNQYVGVLPSGMKDLRGRFDTLGSTVYYGDSPRTAFAEVLSYLRLNRLALAKIAERTGYDSPEAYAEKVLQQTVELEVDRPWAISCRWQNARSIYYVHMPTSGWWVQIDHPDTLDALRKIGKSIGLFEIVTDLTSADLEGRDRDLTTLAAEYIRGLTLDSGHEPLGIYFQSKTLEGRCWAWWNRRGDLDLSPDDNDPRLIESFNVDTAAMREIAARFELPVLVGKPL